MENYVQSEEKCNLANLTQMLLSIARRASFLFTSNFAC